MTICHGTNPRLTQPGSPCLHGTPCHQPSRRLQRQRVRPWLRGGSSPGRGPWGKAHRSSLAHGRRPDARCHPFAGRRAYAGRSRALPCGRARGGGLRGCPTCLWLSRAGADVARPPPPSPPQALLRTQLLLEKGRLQWHGALLGTAFTLQEALASLEAAKASLPDDAPPGGRRAAGGSHRWGLL